MVAAMPDSGMGDPEFLHHPAEQIAVLGGGDGFDGRSQNLDAGLLKLGGDVQWRWPPNWALPPRGCCVISE
jgi:hypothetical protein